MNQLVICRDGVLRITRNIRNQAEDRLYPLQWPLTVFEEQRPGTLLGLLDAEIELDEGVTVGETFTCLKPWAKEVSQLTRCDFAAYLAELEREPDADRLDDSDIITLVYRQEISAVPAYNGDVQDDPLERIRGSRNYEMKNLAPQITDRLSYQGRWEVLAYPENVREYSYLGDRGRSIFLAPLWNLQHLRLRIAEVSWLFDSTQDSEFLSHKQGLFDSHHPGISTLGEREDGLIFARRVRMEAPRPTLKSALLDGLIGEIGFSGSPARRDVDLEGVTESVAESDADARLRASWQDAEGNVDEEKRDAVEVEIAAELAAKEEKKKDERKARPYSDEDLRLLELARELEAREPGLIRAPEGLPDL